MKSLKHLPPKFAERFLSWFCKVELMEEILGDLHEYYEGLPDKPTWKRNIHYWFHVLSFFRPFAVKKMEAVYQQNQYGMFKNYFKVVRRIIWKNKGFSTINLIGLTISISVALIVFLTVNHEYSYDRFHENSERIYRVVSEFNFKGEKFYNAGISPAIPDVMATDISGLEKVASIYQFYPSVKVSYSGTKTTFNPKDAVYTDRDFFKIFSYKWLAGAPEIALSEPYQLVLTKSRCDNYFNSNDYSKLIGETLVYNDSMIVTLQGVVDDFKENSDLIYQEFISRSTIEAAGYDDELQIHNFDGTNNASQLYVKTYADISSENIEGQFPDFLKKYLNQEYSGPTLHLQPLSDIHFSSIYTSPGRTVSKRTLYGIIGVAIFLLALGSINYINLSTAQSKLRSKEVGIRKSLGSSNKQLIRLTMLESISLVVLATAVAFFLVPTLIKIFSTYLPENLDSDSVYQPIVLLFAILVILIVGVLSGFFPGLILSRLEPILAMKSHMRAGKSKISSRHVLTVTQFMISQFLIGITVIMVSQINFSVNKDPGFDKEAVITFRQPYKIETRKSPLIANHLNGISGIENYSMGGNPPIDGSRSSGDFIYKNGNEIIETHVDRKYGDHNYTKVYGLKVISGRNITEGEHKNEALINETYANTLGFINPHDAIGEFIEQDQSQYQIVGVISNFHTSSTHNEIKPLVFFSRVQSHFMVHVKLSRSTDRANNWSKTISELEKVWSEVYPDEEFSYSFLDDKIAAFYKSERQTSQLLKWITSMAIFISCLGLLGLAVFTINQRTKEIGIRKVLGITIPDLVYLLSRDSLKLVLIAIALTIPITWIVAQNWLKNYAYSVELNPWMFALPGLQLVVIAFITIASQSIKAARLNPVNSLRE